MDILATAMPALGDAFGLILQPHVLLYLGLGVVLGLAVGVFPGLGGIAGLSLVLPFMFGMDTVSGLALMVGMVAVVPTSDTFASVLMGIPGSSASQATVLDGFPLAQNGQAARALSAAFASSLFGGLVGALFLTFFILVARPIVLAFALPEMLMVTILGLSMVAILAGRVPLKGLAAACLGLIVGTIGEADAGGSLRMATYDNPYLADGLKLVIVGLGIFAVPEIVALLRQDRSISREAVLGGGWKEGVRDWWRNKILSVRCAIIGVIVGVIPGLGGSVVDWIAYGHTVQTTRDKSKFGSGEIRGIIGPESSNNAKEGGGLVPTLIFGIPGSGSMAVFIGAVALLGSGDLEVGPQMLSPEKLDLTYSIVWLLALANVIGTALCIGLSGSIARLTTIRFTLLAPFLFMLISFAAFQSGQNLADLAALFAIGFLGIFLRRFDWSRPAFLIGFVLSNPAENFTNQAYQVAGSKFRQNYDIGIEYLFSPIVIVLFVITAVSIFLGVRQAKYIMAEGQVASGNKKAPTIFMILLGLYFISSFYDASLISDRLLTDKIFPMFIATVGLFCVVTMLIQMVRLPSSHVIFSDREASNGDHPARGLWPTLAWFGFLLTLTSLVGFILALLVFLLTFMRFRAALSWIKTTAYTAIGITLMVAMADILNRDFPPGLLQKYITLPWPLT